MRTKEETIIFQNQSHLIQEYFKNCNVCPDLLDIVLATDIMVLYITDGYSKSLNVRFDNFQKYINEKYKGNLSDD
jgi:hypothetical protein